ncbi:glutathione S-transferase 2 isoform X2 [Arachis hypogaea]|uniref:glutathione S-transferase 2 isoform X2 n=1 Tax=Arachis hypogaea TaxID=3818 RepID=UPI000DEC4F12|nr:glutathione S-transferase 2 isoform X2 [Arachis hypogaea]
MIVLYSYWLSSCSWRIRFALCLKGIPYEYKAVDLVKGEQFSPEFEKLNPLHCVPVLADDHVVVSDSYAIFLYLEEKYTQKPLLPVDPQIRALNLQGWQQYPYPQIPAAPLSDRGGFEPDPKRGRSESWRVNERGWVGSGSG